MAISATFSKTNKKINSTKLPVAAADDITLSVELKDVTNLFTPSLVISADTFMSGGQIANPMRYNYCYLPDFERYYFVRSWSWICGRWECALEVDVMASFKTEVGNTTAYVLRSASRVNPNIIDTRYPTKAGAAAQPLHERSIVNNIWNTNLKTATISQGFYVIAVTNNDSNAVGSVSHYALSAAAMAEFMSKMYAAPTWMNITDANISTDLQKMMINPIQYVTSCMWIPIGFNTNYATAITTIPIGWWSLTLTSSVYRINDSTMSGNASITVPIKKHPQYGAYKKWVQLSPYTTAALYFPPFGFIPLDTSKMYENDELDLQVLVDFLTGRGELTISSRYIDSVNPGNSRLGNKFYHATAQVGVPMSIAQMSIDKSAVSSMSTWVGAAGIALATGGLQDSLKNLANGLIDGVKSVFTTGSAANAALTTAISPVGGGLGMLLNRFSGENPAVGQAMQAGLSKAGFSTKGVESNGGTSILSTLKEIAGDIGSAALAIMGTCNSTGSTGGFASLDEQIQAFWYFTETVDDDPTHVGYPLCASYKINTFTGFVLCGNTDDFTANCTPAERQAVRGIMEAGFYYE